MEEDNSLKFPLYVKATAVAAIVTVTGVFAYIKINSDSNPVPEATLQENLPRDSSESDCSAWKLKYQALEQSKIRLEIEKNRLLGEYLHQLVHTYCKTPPCPYTFTGESTDCINAKEKMWAIDEEIKRLEAKYPRIVAHEASKNSVGLPLP